MFRSIVLFVFVLSTLSLVICEPSSTSSDDDAELDRRSNLQQLVGGSGRLSRSKRDAFDYMLKKKGLSMAAGALIAAASVSKKKFMPVPIVFPLPIMKPPIIETFPAPMPFMPFMGKGALMGGLGGLGGLGGMGGFGYGRR